MQGANFLKNRVQENYASTLTKQRKYNIFMLLYSLIFSLILYFQSSKMYAHGLELLQSARASAQPTPLPWPPLNVRNSKPTIKRNIWASEWYTESMSATYVPQISGGDGAECLNDSEKKLCCNQDIYKDCFWSGTAPLCGGVCDGDYETVSDSKCGDGKVCISGLKKLCCKRKWANKSCCVQFASMNDILETKIKLATF